MKHLFGLLFSGVFIFLVVVRFWYGIYAVGIVVGVGFTVALYFVGVDFYKRVIKDN